MFKRFYARAILVAYLVVFYASTAISKEYSLEADIDARAEYNDNIFLTDLPHDSVQGIIITPSLTGVIKEKNWQSQLRARLRNYNYSDSGLNGTDQLFDLSGQYTLERNIFSLSVNHNLDSNLNSTSTDFGTIIGRRIDRKSQSITPQYSRLLTERSILQVTYSYNDVDFLEAEDTGFTPYIVQSASGSLIYELTEKDKLTLNLSTVDYESKNELVTYQLFQSQIGLAHEFSRRLSADFLVGVSRRNVTNKQTQSFDFFGQPITITQEIDSKSRGLVYDAGISQLLETGNIEGRVSRNETTNSFGGLDEINQLKIVYTDKLSDLWRYKINGRYDDIKSVGSSTIRTDRDVFLLEGVVYYSINRNWGINASYRYITRKYKSDTSDDRAPYSNRIFIGLTYNFPSLSTF